ncbi:MAG: GH116 family glycosyl-hydrolase, partial [Planctomycetota bacterium]|nr:GH116 family glycosyl-hydrolase [Planctomycetota bacterium]
MRKLLMTINVYAVCICLVAFHCTISRGQEQTSHLVPADKNLSQDTVKSFFERGERGVFRGKELDTIGMPVGGIATGQLYLRGDGTLGLWQIFNEHIFSGYGSDNYRTYKPDSPVESGFAVIVEKDGKTIAKPLNQSFSTLEFAGEYPVGIVHYSQKDFPVKVELEAFSPFIPLNAKDSSLPAVLFHITAENTADKPVRASVLGWLENAVLINSAKQLVSAKASEDTNSGQERRAVAGVDAMRRSRVVTEKGRTLLIHTVEEAPAEKGAVVPRPKVVLLDFEGADYGDWKASGEAFGKGPANGTLPNQQNVSGFLGK